MDFEMLLARAVLDAQMRVQSAEASSIGDAGLYKEALRDAADKAVEEVGLDLRMNEPVYLLLNRSWDSIRDWAIDILEIENEVA